MKWLDWVSSDRRLKRIWFLIIVVALGALAVRASRLRMRPMHTDEAVNAEKFHRLLEGGWYEYDPNEFHGPTLNYFTLIPARLSGANQYAQITEVTLRIVPVVFGTALILLAVFLADGLGLAAVPAAVLTALSPAMVFYSRYYIQEMLLVCFTFGAFVAGYRYVRARSLVWAVVTGFFIGLMRATKETAIIAFGAMGLALVLVALIQLGQGRSLRQLLAGVKPLHIVLGLAAAEGVSALFYSSFLSHPRGILDSYLSYATYLGRAGGQNTWHVQPWYYYLRILLFARYEHGPIWTEGWIVLLALVGLTATVEGTPVGGIDPKLVRFIAIYTVVMTAVYSAIPYKTPWCLLSFLHGMILLAGVGAVTLLAWVRKPVPRAVLAVSLILAVAHLAFQAYRANFVCYADSRNPYVYAHPTEEILIAAEKVREYVDPNGLGYSERMPIQVAVPGRDYWPLPWYLRDLPAVAWYSTVPEEIAPLILISDELESALAHKLYDETPPEKRQMYMYLFDEPYYVWARPKVKLLGFVRKDLWERHYDQQSDSSELLGGRRGE